MTRALVCHHENGTLSKRASSSAPSTSIGRFTSDSGMGRSGALYQREKFRGDLVRTLDAGQVPSLKYGQRAARDGFVQILRHCDGSGVVFFAHQDCDRNVQRRQVMAKIRITEHHTTGGIAVEVVFQKNTGR